MSKFNSWPEVVEQIPDYALLMLPPFPTNLTVKSLRQWSKPGIWSTSLSKTDSQTQSETPVAKDAYDNNLVDIGGSEESTESLSIHRQQRRFVNGGGLLRLPNIDCFKLGQENSEWEEPMGTGRLHSYEVSRPPFDRLLTATRDFFESRSEAFQTTRTKRLFGQMRSAFGIRSDLPGRHWSGSGSDGQPYTMPSMTTRAERWIDGNQLPLDDEVCVLLRSPEKSLRGYVALLRREFEAGWEIGPSIKIAEIMATYFAYIDHYKVFTDSPLDKQFERAARLASLSPRLLREAHTVEENIARARGINRATWTVWGGQYGMAERPTSEKPCLGADDAEASGWEVQRPIDDRPPPLTADQVISHVKPLIAPVDDSAIVMLGQIPYARRLVTAVLPPSEEPTGPAFQRVFCRLVTVPAPWNDAEGWRRQTLLPIVSDETDFLDSSDPTNSEVLEGELETITEPEELVIWVEPEAIQGEGGATLDVIGMGLRGRWGLFGTVDGIHSWWAFKAKDYILPSIWLDIRGHSTLQASPGVEGQK